ncbi:MAG: transposase [Thiotrichales bacterium]|jgi:putative transposase|nr:transposase [Thiotrichales bacterium]MBT4971506.1 transposase [Thiotrichales bacterium]MBT5291441.1 transposase [Thiotrichales bacterium]MBT5418536.1 transposase [Thiotrichales bacterium]MBT7870680.1 transposase [Thiotrichales bacterium]
MARLKRITPAGIPQHIIQRGNNKRVCFTSNADMKAYLKWLKDFSDKYSVSIHAWVLMTNHIHILCTPKTDNGIGKMMQSLGRMYVGYFNHTYQRTGTLWEGRYKSSIIQSERYLLAVYRYIELNPVRADMVISPSEYSWSSYNFNALGIVNDLITPHQEYLALGDSASERNAAYIELFKIEVDGELLNNIGGSINKGLALGSDAFIKEIEALTKVRVSSRKAGRPKKNVG